MAYFSPGGGVRVSVIPRVCRTRSDFPSSQVSLPFSRSMINRRPVPRSGRDLLRDAQAFAGVPDHVAELLGRVFQAPPKYYRTEYYSSFGEVSKCYCTGIKLSL